MTNARILTSGLKLLNNTPQTEEEATDKSNLELLDAVLQDLDQLREEATLLNGLTSTAAQIDAAAIAPIRVQHKDGTTSGYYPTDTDADRGTSLASALASSVSGDTIYLSANVFDLQTTQGIVPAGVTIRGAGKYSTRIWSLDTAHATATIIFGDGSSAYDLTLDVAVKGAETTRFRAVSTAGDNCTARLYNCAVYGNSDALYIGRNGSGAAYENSHWYAYNCDLLADYDAANIVKAGNSTINLYNCYCNTTRGWCGWTYTGGHVRGIGIANGGTGNIQLNAYDCLIISSWPACPTASANICAVFNITNLSTGRIHLHNCRTIVNQGIKTTTTAPPTDLLQSGAANVPMTIVGGSGTNGTFTQTGTPLPAFQSNGTVGQQLSLPVAPSGTPSTSGGSMADGSYYYVITALDASGGETTQGMESAIQTITGGGGSGSVSLTWTAVSGAVSYKVYRSTTTMTYATPCYIANPATNSYTDTALNALAGAPPSINTAYAIKMSAGALFLTDAMKPATLTTTLTGAAGTAICSMPFQGLTFKKVIIRLNGFTDHATPANNTYTYPTPFTYAPTVLGDASGIGVTATVSDVTKCVLSGASTDTGVIILEGY